MKPFTGMAIAMVAAVALLAGCTAQDRPWTVSAGSNYKTSTFTGLWSPDPNGGIGVRMTTDSLIPEGTRDNIAIGPAANFYLNDLAGAVLDTVLPGDWDPLKGAPVRVYGTLAFLWETDNHKFIFLPGTEFRLFPDRPIHPCVWVDYLMPQSGAGVGEGLLTTFGVAWEF